MCFNGKVECIFTVTERFSEGGIRITVFDKEWNVLPFGRHCQRSEKIIHKPFNLEKMIKLAEILSKNISFIRVDFYEVNMQLYFGELTFYPASGFEEFAPEEWDLKLGQLLHIPSTT